MGAFDTNNSGGHWRLSGATQSVVAVERRFGYQVDPRIGDKRCQATSSSMLTGS